MRNGSEEWNEAFAKMHMCGFVDVRILDVVKCGEILQIYLRMWQCGYTTNERMPAFVVLCFKDSAVLCV